MAGIADLIIGGLDGEHLSGFLPGSDNRAAIARAVASRHHWSGPGYWCAVTRDGFGDWGARGLETELHLKERRADAVLFVTWGEALDVIRRGCADGHREAYEAAHRAWCAAAAAAHDAYRAWCAAAGPRDRGAPDVMFPDPGDMRRATSVLIRHGCDQLEVQGALF